MDKLTIKEKIIIKLNELIIITHNIYDYILIEDLMFEFKNYIKLNENKIKKVIFNFLKENINLNIAYSSKVIGKYNKRGYMGIIWKDKNKIKVDINKHYHFHNNYNLNELLTNSEKREEFISFVDKNMNNINWPPINIIFYNRVYWFDCVNKICKNTHITQPNINTKEINIKKKELVIDNNLNIFLKENLIETTNKKDILFTETILLKYDSTINLKNNYSKYIRIFILKNFCNNDINILNTKYIYRSNSKRGYCYMKLK